MVLYDQLLGYCQEGDELRGLEHSFAQGTRKQLVFIATSPHLAVQQNDSSIGMRHNNIILYELDHAEI